MPLALLAGGMALPLLVPLPVVALPVVPVVALPVVPLVLVSGVVLVEPVPVPAPVPVPVPVPVEPVEGEVVEEEDEPEVPLAPDGVSAVLLQPPSARAAARASATAPVD